MITKDEIEQSRTPVELREFVDRKHSEIGAKRSEIHAARFRKGIYKQYMEEIVPLARCVERIYPQNVRIRPVLGNQGYDALVFDMSGNKIEKIEVALPYDGKEYAKDAQLMMERGYGEFKVFQSDEPLRRLIPRIIKVATKKAKKDYSDCTLLLVVDYEPHWDRENPLLLNLIDGIVRDMKQIQFKAKRVILAVMPLNQIRVVQEAAA